MSSEEFNSVDNYQQPSQLQSNLDQNNFSNSNISNSESLIEKYQKKQVNNPKTAMLYYLWIRFVKTIGNWIFLAIHLFLNLIILIVPTIICSSANSDSYWWKYTFHQIYDSVFLTTLIVNSLFIVFYGIYLGTKLFGNSKFDGIELLLVSKPITRRDIATMRIVFAIIISFFYALIFLIWMPIMYAISLIGLDKSIVNSYNNGQTIVNNLWFSTKFDICYGVNCLIAIFGTFFACFFGILFFCYLSGLVATKLSTSSTHAILFPIATISLIVTIITQISYLFMGPLNGDIEYVIDEKTDKKSGYSKISKELNDKFIEWFCTKYPIIEIENPCYVKNNTLDANDETINNFKNQEKLSIKTKDVFELRNNKKTGNISEKNNIVLVYEQSSNSTSYKESYKIDSPTILGNIIGNDKEEYNKYNTYPYTTGIKITKSNEEFFKIGILPTLINFETLVAKLLNNKYGDDFNLFTPPSNITPPSNNLSRNLPILFDSPSIINETEFPSQNIFDAINNISKNKTYIKWNDNNSELINEIKNEINKIFANKQINLKVDETNLSITENNIFNKTANINFSVTGDDLNNFQFPSYSNVIKKDNKIFVSNLSLIGFDELPSDQWCKYIGTKLVEKHDNFFNEGSYNFKIDNQEYTTTVQYQIVAEFYQEQSKEIEKILNKVFNNNSPITTVDYLLPTSSILYMQGIGQSAHFVNYYTKLTFLPTNIKDILLKNDTSNIITSLLYTPITRNQFVNVWESYNKFKDNNPNSASDKNNSNSNASNEFNKCLQYSNTLTSLDSYNPFWGHIILNLVFIPLIAFFVWYLYQRKDFS